MLARNQDTITHRGNCLINVVHIGARRDNPIAHTDTLKVSRDIFAVANDPEVDILVELIGGTTTAKALVLQAISRGKHIVTANKALIAEHGNELFAAAKQQGVTIAFEAAVAGGIPVIKVLREGLAANRIEWLTGIINGTGNFILTEMAAKQRSFDSVLHEAQALGYAEADPTFDIEGIDAAHKLTILAALAFNIPLQYDSIYIEGISPITIEDLQYAQQLGYCIKHLGIARQTKQGIELRVHPALVPETHVLAQVNGVMNAVLIQSDAVGTTLHYGAGAGGEPTASAVIADIIDLARTGLARAHTNYPAPGSNSNHSAKPILAINDIHSAYYLRLSLHNKPGALSQVSQQLSDAGISIEAVIQKEPSTPEQTHATVIVLTHSCQEQKINDALQHIERLNAVDHKVARIRVETLEP